MALKYRLVALDLDGTVIDREGVVVAGAREAIRDLLERGLRVTLATGRMYQPTNRFAEHLGISAPLICHQGALIREPGHGEVLSHVPLTALLARRVIAELREAGVHRYAYADGAIYVEQERENDIRYARHNGVELRLVDDLVEIAGRQPTEIAARGEPAAIDYVVGRLRERCDSEVIVGKIHASFCEIASARSGKGNALRFVAERLGVRQDQVVAIGDSPNDVSMLKWAALGIAVGDAPPEVRASADWVIDHSGGDSFARAIGRLLNTISL